MNTQPHLFVVGGELSDEAIARLVGRPDVCVQRFSSNEAFVDFCDQSHPTGCVLADLGPAAQGLELQAALQRREVMLPIVFLTAQANTPATVAAMKAGAVTILERPFGLSELWEGVREGLRRAMEQRARYERAEQLRQRFHRLTLPERQVLDLILEGLPNKSIAARLGVSLRTVENRRREVYKKLDVHAVAGLARLVLEFRALERPAACSNGCLH